MSTAVRFNTELSMLLSMSLMPPPNNEKALEIAEFVKRQMREGRINEKTIALAASVFQLYKLVPEMIDALLNIAELDLMLNTFLQPQPLRGSGVLFATNLPFTGAAPHDINSAEFVAPVPDSCNYIQLSIRQVEIEMGEERAGEGGGGGEEAEEARVVPRRGRTVLLAIQCLESYPQPQPQPQEVVAGEVAQGAPSDQASSPPPPQPSQAPSRRRRRSEP